MTINELRHFNYVYLNGYEHPIRKISGFRAYHYPHPMVEIENVSGLYGIHTISPIPITEDILLKFGAKKHNEYWFSFHTYGIIKHTKFIEFYSCIEGDFICNSVQYVHQLQNLYFALTGEDIIFSTEP